MMGLKLNHVSKRTAEIACILQHGHKLLRMDIMHVGVYLLAVSKSALNIILLSSEQALYIYFLFVCNSACLINHLHTRNNAFWCWCDHIPFDHPIVLKICTVCLPMLWFSSVQFILLTQEGLYRPMSHVIVIDKILLSKIRNSKFCIPMLNGLLNLAN